jgi:uncharacterized protein (TIGR02996 family)
VSEREALLKAVCDNPDDDTPRLVLADWLDENGEPERAEFIRLQIEIAALPDGKTKQKKQAREKKLLAAHGEEWTEPLKEFESGYFGEPFRFARGFIESIGLDDETLIERGEELFALAPIREVRFGELEEYEDIAKCKHLLRLSTLDLTGSGMATEFDFDVNRLFRSKYLANLTTLIARGKDDNGHLDAGGLRALAESKHLAKLQCLDISNNWMFGTHQYAPRAAACRKALWKLGENKPALRELRLSNIGLLDRDLSGLVTQKWVGQLRVLDLSRNGLAEAGCRALCESKYLGNVEQLILTANEYHDPDANTLTPLTPAARRMLKKRFGKRVVL